MHSTRSLAAHISVQLLLLLLQILRRILLECQILQQVLVHHGASMRRVERRCLLLCEVVVVLGQA